MLELNKIFCSGMILQANKPINVFGTGKGSIKIELAGVTQSLVSNSEKWMIVFPEMNYGGPYNMYIRLDERSMILENIFIGDVYLISGQSNLKLKLKKTNEPHKDYITDGNVVSYTVASPEPEVFSQEDGWVTLKKEQAENWSALGYYIGTNLSKHTNHKNGLVFCYHGAAAIQSFLPEVIARKKSVYIEPEKRFRDCNFFWNKDGYMYNLMISAISGFRFKAVVWYQGESNVSSAESSIYENLLTELILCYRDEFCDKNLPFVIVQLADYDERDDDNWHRIQKIQNDIQYKLPYIKTVVSRDVCETNDIHPRSKRELGKRISIALENL